MMCSAADFRVVEKCVVSLGGGLRSPSSLPVSYEFTLSFVRGGMCFCRIEKLHDALQFFCLHVYQP